jgi:hypothetical protein
MAKKKTKKTTKKKAASSKRRPPSKDLGSEMRRLINAFRKAPAVLKNEMPKNDEMAMRSMVSTFADSLDAASDALGERIACVIRQHGHGDDNVSKQSWEHDKMLVDCLVRGHDEMVLALEAGSNGIESMTRGVAAMSRFLKNRSR